MIFTAVLIITLCVMSEGRNYTLEELKHVFDGPQQSDQSVVYIDNTKDFKCNNTTKLVLYYERDIDLNFLYSCNQLEEFWIEYKTYRDYKFLHKIFLDYNVSKIVLKKLHINVCFKFFNDFVLLIQKLNMTVVDLSDARFISSINELINMTETLASTSNQLVAISFDNYLHKMKVVPYIYSLNFTEVFGPLKQHPIQYLSLRYNGIAYITGHILDTLPLLRIIDLCENNFFFPVTHPSLYEMALLHPNLEVVCFSMQEPQIIDHNDKNIVNDPEFGKFHIRKWTKCLRGLHATANDLLNKTVLCMFSSCMLEYDYKWLLDHGLCDKIPAVPASLLNPNCEYGVIIPITSSVKEVFFENVFDTVEQDIDKTICIGENKIEKVTIKNMGSFFNTSKWDGLNKLKSLKIEQSVDFNISDSIMTNFPYLEELLFDDGKINIMTDEIKWNLTSITLTHAKITEIKHYNLLTNSPKMKKIDLSHNKLIMLDIDISNMRYLEVINISHNPLKFITKRTIGGLMKTRQPMILDLENTYLTCGCDEDSIATIKFLTQAEKYNVSVHHIENLLCELSSNSYERLNISSPSIIAEIESKCYVSYTFWIIGICTGNGILIATITMYKCRFHIYTRMLRLKWKWHYRKEKDVQYIYDAFVCYSALDRFWVHNVLMKELEGKYGFRLCIHYRDFGFGCIADMIVTKLSQSRCIIFTLSKASLNSGWCQQELQIAYDQCVRLQKTLIIVKLGNIPRSSVQSPLIQQFLDSRVYIKWPDLNHDNKTSNEIMQLFWAKLTSGLYEETKTYLTCCRSYFGYKILDEAADDDDNEENDQQEVE